MTGQVSLLLLLTLFLSACGMEPAVVAVTSTTEPQPVEAVIPDTTVDKALLTYNPQGAVWLLDASPYSGHAVVAFPDGSLEERMGFIAGKKHGPASRWFADGHLRQEAHFVHGKLHGDKKTWAKESGHVLLAHLHYERGKAHGEQRKWYPTGELYKVLHLEMGREEGLQRAFRKNGELYANYEAKNGRIFGLKKAALCYGLENETVVYGQ
ncbi:hypothetical protein A3850_011880 [Lewinella sp. 4G2]|nr:hypothetical protein A3850_011880 [Lewinella sp. 4G2]